jgi:hypothetical protein
LFQSDFFATATGDELRAAIKLWCAAWVQAPAGSLPSADKVVQYHAGLDQNIRLWNRVKEAALHGFVLCNDGRIYHPYVVRLAQEAFARREGDRVRQSKRRARQSSQPIENTQYPSECHADSTVTSIGHHAVVTRDKDKDKDKDTNTEATHRTVNSEQPARVASLEVVQGPNSSTVQPPAAVNDRHLMPRANDPPHRWIGSGLSRGPDRQPRTELVGTEPRLVAGIPGVNRVMVDHVARAVCEAALYEPSSRLDWNVLVDWLDSGLDIDLHILPGIRAVVERQSKGEKGYKQPGTLRYFTPGIREYVRRGAAARTPQRRKPA